MKDTIYFLHDYDAQEDPKVIKLRMKYGWEWYGLYRAILEGMRWDANVLLRQCDIDAFAFRSQYDCIKLTEFIDFCVGVGLFIYDEKDKVYYSKRLQEDVEYMRDKSKKAKRSANARRKARSNANALQMHSDGNAIYDNIVYDKREKENTESQIILPVEEQPKVDKSNPEINSLISEIKNTCSELKIVYDKDDERNFTKHILTAKEFWLFAESLWETRHKAAIWVLKISVQIDYFKGYASWPKKIYKNYAEIYNKRKQKEANPSSVWYTPPKPPPMKPATREEIERRFY